MCSAYAKVLRGCTGTSPNPSANMPPLISFTMRNPQATGNLGAMCAAALTFGLTAFQVVCWGQGLKLSCVVVSPCCVPPWLWLVHVLAETKHAGRYQQHSCITVKTQAPEHDIAAKRASGIVADRSLALPCGVLRTCRYN